MLALAGELELVDVTPSILDERLRRGDIVPPAEAARALQGEFRPRKPARGVTARPAARPAPPG